MGYDPDNDIDDLPEEDTLWNPEKKQKHRKHWDNDDDNDDDGNEWGNDWDDD